jgi:hypothetical protein
MTITTNTPQVINYEAATAGVTKALVVPATKPPGNFAGIQWNNCCRQHRDALNKAGIAWQAGGDDARGVKRPDNGEASRGPGYFHSQESGTMKAIIEFSLPDDEPEHRYALAGREALLALEAIDNWARGILKHGEPCDETRKTLEHIREQLIPHELTGLLQ